jgi:hypothetical protein
MRRSLALAFFLCLAAASGFAQSRLDGKWATDRPADPLTFTDAQRKQSVQLEVSIEDAKASGTLSIGGLGGTFYIFKDGKVAGNKVQFQLGLQDIEPTWTIEMVDDNTAMLSRGDLPLVGKDVLDLFPVMRGPGQPALSAQVGAKVLISGIVQDTSKALIPSATVTATNLDTGVKLITVTDGAGLYAFAMTPGKYALSASLPAAFKTATVSNLSIGATPILQDFTLELPTSGASANLSAASCNANGIVWCTLLHRAK